VSPGPRHLRNRLRRWLPGGWPAVAASTAVATFLSLEGRLRQDAAARSLSADGGDAGTTRAIGATLPVALLGPPLLAAATRRRWPAAIGWSGATLAAVGTALRLGSAVALGASYTRTLRVGDAQRVVDTGLYAHIRHPGYAGTLTMLLGYAMAWQAPAAVLPALPMLPIYIRRITAEERLLVADLGEPYVAYSERTARLLPAVW
jgi:protein-S-isoprenylcysteine O-methyltransferase Ste14